MLVSLGCRTATGPTRLLLLPQQNIPYVRYPFSIFRGHRCDSSVNNSRKRVSQRQAHIGRRTSSFSLTSWNTRHVLWSHQIEVNFLFHRTSSRVDAAAINRFCRLRPSWSLTSDGATRGSEGPRTRLLRSFVGKCRRFYSIRQTCRLMGS